MTKEAHSFCINLWSVMEGKGRRGDRKWSIDVDCDGREGLVAGWGVGASLWSVMEGKGGR